MDLQEAILQTPQVHLTSDLSAKRAAEIVCEDNLRDEARNLYILMSKGFVQNEWRWVPATIEDWVMGKKYLNLKGVVRPVVYEDIRDFFHTEGSPWERQYDEAVFCEGIGSGKSFKISIIATFFEHLLLCMKEPQKYFGIDKSSKIAIMNMSISEKNAKKVIFSEIAAKIADCEWFQERTWKREDARCPDPNCLSELRFKNNTFIIPGSSSWRTAVGYNILIGIMDEAGGYRSKDNKDQAEDIYHTLSRRIGSRFGNKGALVMAGSPMYESDFLEKKVIEGELGASHILSRRRNLWDSMYYDWSGDFFYVDRINRRLLESMPEDMKDVDKIPHVPFLFKAFRANVTKAYRDFGARPSETINAFFEYPRILIENVNKERIEDPVNANGTFKEWFKPIDEFGFHAVHIDLALTGDACGLALGHFAGLNAEGGIKIYIDLMMRLRGSKDYPIQIAGVREYIYAFSKMGFNIQLITFDGFQSSDSIQILEKKGYRCELQSVDRTIIPFSDLKESINENRLDYYCSSPQGSNLEMRLKELNNDLSASEVFLKECMHLEDIQGKKIDHPPKGSKDVADAVCGVVHGIVTNSDYYGTMSVGIL